MKYNKWRYLCGITVILTIFVLPFLSIIQDFLAVPNQINISTEPIPITTLGKNVAIDQSSNQVVEISQNQLKPKTSGNTSLFYHYNGIPFKKVNVNVSSGYQVIPGGQSIGVNLQTLGVLVVGFHHVGDEENPSSPGQEAGVEIGDIILSINEQSIQSIDQIAPFVEDAAEEDQAMLVKIKRDNKTFTKELRPKYDTKTEGYRMGLYIRDSAAGIGTMTFYDPVTKKYGALGHVISDMDTKEPIEIESGSIVRSTITSIQKGDSGKPGEKRASFNKKNGMLGSITKNSSFGVFGELEHDLLDSQWSEPLTVSRPEEVKEGPAQILTVIDGEEIEAFDVEIINAINQKNPATKGMVLKITDEKLLKETGGIVQGMSGSPIIQDNKIIGAVTHVFVNDPTSGYGIHIEWMLDEAGINHEESMSYAS